MKNLQQIIIEYLDSIGADGLMVSFDGTFFGKDKISEAVRYGGAIYLVPAYRHADGSYHAEEEVDCPCVGCPTTPEECEVKYRGESCYEYQSWLSHKEEAK